MALRFSSPLRNHVFAGCSWVDFFTSSPLKKSATFGADLCVLIRTKKERLCAVGMAGSFFLFIAKVVNILRNFFLFLKAPGLNERVVLITKPAAVCPVGPGTNI